MGLSLVTAPTTEPVTLAEVKAHLKIDDANSDGILAGYLMAARQYAEAYTRRVLAPATYDHTLDWGWPYDSAGRRIVRLPLTPVSSVSSVTYIDTNGASQTLSASTYALYGASDAEPVAYLAEKYDQTWPDVRVQRSAITVRFVAGWTLSTIPEPLRAALLLHVELLHDRDPAARETLEMARDSLLDPYRILRVL